MIDLVHEQRQEEGSVVVRTEGDEGENWITARLHALPLTTLALFRLRPVSAGGPLGVPLNPIRQNSMNHRRADDIGPLPHLLHHGSPDGGWMRRIK